MPGGSGRAEGGDAFLIVSVSAVVLLAVAVGALVRWAGLKAWHAGVCVLAGFYLASTSVAPAIGRAVTAVVRAVTGQA
jgi:hypothetical protein